MKISEMVQDLIDSVQYDIDFNHVVNEEDLLDGLLGIREVIENVKQSEQIAK